MVQYDIYPGKAVGKLEHDRIAKSIAKKLGAEYNNGKGPDIKTPTRVIEVEPSPETFPDGIRQLQGFKRPCYLGVASEHVAAAIERTKNTTVGVMDENGKIHKPAGGRRRKPGRRRIKK
jgi:hypothetical protein